MVSMNVNKIYINLIQILLEVLHYEISNINRQGYGLMAEVGSVLRNMVSVVH